MPWVEREVAWHDLSVEYCEVTWQLLPQRYWSFEVDGRTPKALDPRYEELYRGYRRDGQAPATTADGDA